MTRIMVSDQHSATYCCTLQHTAALCNALQCIATHCNTLKHTEKTSVALWPASGNTAMHCNTLQHTATGLLHCDLYPGITSTLCKIPKHTAQHCNTLQRTATHWDRSIALSPCDLATLQHTATNYITLQHTATHCNTLQHTATHCNRSAALWPAPWHHCTTLHHTVTYYNTLQQACCSMTCTQETWYERAMGNTWQHNAMHCNTLHHIATHCNTLKHTEIGLLHCDPHPGNLLRTSDGRLCILDWGLVIRVDAEVCSIVLQRVAACCSVLLCVASCCNMLRSSFWMWLVVRVDNVVCCSVLQYVAVCCSV